MLDAQLGTPSPKCLPLTCYIILSMLLHISAPLLPIYKMELIFTTWWNHKNCSQQLRKALKTWYKTHVSVSSQSATMEPGSCCTALHAALLRGLMQHQQHTLQHSIAPSPPTDQNYLNPTVTVTILPYQAQTINNTQFAFSFKMNAGLQVEDKSPSTTSPFKVQVSPAQILEKNEMSRNSAILSVCQQNVQGLEKEKRLAFLCKKLSISLPGTQVRNPGEAQAASGQTAGQQSM